MLGATAALIGRQSSLGDEPYDARLCRLVPSLMTALISADLSRQVVSALPPLSRLTPSRGIPYTICAQNRVPDLNRRRDDPVPMSAARTQRLPLRIEPKVLQTVTAATGAPGMTWGRRYDLEHQSDTRPTYILHRSQNWVPRWKYPRVAQATALPGSPGPVMVTGTAVPGLHSL